MGRAEIDILTATTRETLSLVTVTADSRSDTYRSMDTACSGNEVNAEATEVLSDAKITNSSAEAAAGKLLGGAAVYRISPDDMQFMLAETVPAIRSAAPVVTTSSLVKVTAAQAAPADTVRDPPRTLNHAIIEDDRDTSDRTVKLIAVMLVGISSVTVKAAGDVSHTLGRGTIVKLTMLVPVNVPPAPVKPSSLTSSTTL